MPTVRTRSYLRSKFENGDKPPQGDFWDWIESFWHKSETPGPVTLVAPGGVTTYAMPEGSMLTEIVVYGTPAGTVTVEKQTSGGEIFLDEPYGTDGNPVLFRPIFFPVAETLGFSATGGTVTIKLYYR